MIYGCQTGFKMIYAGDVLTLLRIASPRRVAGQRDVYPLGLVSFRSTSNSCPVVSSISLGLVIDHSLVSFSSLNEHNLARSGCCMTLRVYILISPSAQNPIPASPLYATGPLVGSTYGLRFLTDRSKSLGAANPSSDPTRFRFASDIRSSYGIYSVDRPCPCPCCCCCSSCPSCICICFCFARSLSSPIPSFVTMTRVQSRFVSEIIEGSCVQRV